MPNFFSHKTILVTGGAGFIGSHLVEKLLQLEAEVIVVDNFVSGSRANLNFNQSESKSSQSSNQPADNNQPSNLEIIEADVNYPPENYLPQNTKIDAVFHLASPASPPLYQQYPRLTYLVNSWGTHQLLDYLFAHQPQARFLFASTSEVYGDPEVHPQPESYWGNVNPNGPRSCYDESKRLGETICGVHQRDLGMDVRIARIFNSYGPRMDPEDGRVVPNFIQQAIEGKKFTIYGDGSQTRSYCYVTDLVAGLIQLMSCDELCGATINVGNPQEFTVMETAQLINQVVNGQELSVDNIEYETLPTDDPTRRQPDISLAKSKLNWQPHVNFQQGLELTVAYFREQLDQP